MKSLHRPDLFSHYHFFLLFFFYFFFQSLQLAFLLLHCLNQIHFRNIPSGCLEIFHILELTEVSEV
jgi:hypothetical protein